MSDKLSFFNKRTHFLSVTLLSTSNLWGLLSTCIQNYFIKKGICMPTVSAVASQRTSKSVPIGEHTWERFSFWQKKSWLSILGPGLSAPMLVEGKEMEICGQISYMFSYLNLKVAILKSRRPGVIDLISAKLEKLKIRAHISNPCYRVTDT